MKPLIVVMVSIYNSHPNPILRVTTAIRTFAMGCTSCSPMTTNTIATSFLKMGQVPL